MTTIEEYNKKVLESMVDNLLSMESQILKISEVPTGNILNIRESIKKLADSNFEDKTIPNFAKIIMYAVFADETYLSAKEMKKIVKEGPKYLLPFMPSRFQVFIHSETFSTYSAAHEFEPDEIDEKIYTLDDHSKKLLEPMLLAEYPDALYYVGTLASAFGPININLGSFETLNKNEGLLLMQSAAAKGNPRLQHTLSLYYFEIGGFLNYDSQSYRELNKQEIKFLHLAIFWIYFAVEQGYEGAENTIVDMYDDLDEMSQYLPTNKFMEGYAQDFGLEFINLKNYIGYIGEKKGIYWEDFMHDCLIKSANRGYENAVDYFSTYTEEELECMWPDHYERKKIIKNSNVIPFPKNEEWPISTLIDTCKLLEEDQFESSDNIKQLIKGGEGINLEFKETFSFDTKSKQNKANHIRYAAIKEICSFLNTEGGKLLIGVTDQGNIAGIEKDRFDGDWDKYHRTITQVIKECIGPSFTNLIKIQKIKVGQQNICAITCEKSNSPVYCNFKGEKNKIFIRNGSIVTSPNHKDWDDWKLKYFIN